MAVSDTSTTISSSRSSISISNVPNNSNSNHKRKTKKLVLLDRDGVINQDVGSPGVIDPSQLQLTPQAGLAIGNLKRAGYTVALITNQSCVGKGLITLEQLQHNIMPRLQDLLVQQDSDATWDAVYMCTTTIDIVDHRRKPGPGMIQEAMTDFFDPTPSQDDPVASTIIFVGDTLTDLQAAHSAGVSTRILVSTGYGQGLMHQAGFGNNNLMQQNNYIRQVYAPKQSAASGKNDNPVRASLEAVMPFVYASNLYTASKWILHYHEQQQQQKQEPEPWDLEE